MEVWGWGERTEGLRCAEIWLELNSQGVAVAQCTVERLMRDLGIRGASPRWKRPPTTLPGDLADRPSDLLDRCFGAAALNRRWVILQSRIRAILSACCLAFEGNDGCWPRTPSRAYPGTGHAPAEDRESSRGRNAPRAVPAAIAATRYRPRGRPGTEDLSAEYFAQLNGKLNHPDAAYPCVGGSAWAASIAVAPPSLPMPLEPHMSYCGRL